MGKGLMMIQGTDNSTSSQQARQAWTCRCEEVAERSVIEAIAWGAATLSDVKRATRAGMGLCQGIFCGPEIARLIAHHAGVSRETIVPMTARPPVRLLTLETLATLGEPE